MIMIICMNSEIFLNHFIHEQKPNVILEATYIVASNKIRYGKRYSGQIETMLMPNEVTIMAMNDEHSIKSESNSEYVKKYFSEMDEDIRNISIIIKMSLMKNILVVVLTTKREEKAYGHIELFREYIRNKFDINIPMYKPNMNLDDISVKNKYEIIELCDKLISKDRKKEKKMLMKSEKGQREYFSCLDKKELKKLLKKESLYRPGMDEAEMIEICMTFLT